MTDAETIRDLQDKLETSENALERVVYDMESLTEWGNDLAQKNNALHKLMDAQDQRITDLRFENTGLRTEVSRLRKGKESNMIERDALALRIYEALDLPLRNIFSEYISTMMSEVQDAEIAVSTYKDAYQRSVEQMNSMRKQIDDLRLANTSLRAEVKRHQKGQ